jgi:ribosomal protein S18 acetylase RimI-like enzyme
LLTTRLNACAEQGVAACLETSNERNIRYYERFGFTVTDEITVRNGPTVWPMWRAPG